MLQNVRFINYRGLKDTTLPLAPVTLLTGTNAIGKTSILEGLYFLLSQVPDAVVFPRYQMSIGYQTNVNTPNGLPFYTPFISKGYDYASFWKECPTSGTSGCQVEADLGDCKLTWKMKISDFALIPDELKTAFVAYYGHNTGITTQYALWEWNCTGTRKDNDSQEMVDVNHGAKAMQQLSMERCISPITGNLTNTVCRYVDMSSTKYIPGQLPYLTEKWLAPVLKMINSDVTGVRLDAGVQPPRLRVIINEIEFSLGTLGVGAEAWASMLLLLAELLGTSTGQASVMFLVDEIGAGIHYSKLGEMWDFLLMFVQTYPQIQMVLTTHSHDCINAFCKTFQNATPGMAHIVRLFKLGPESDVLTTVYQQDVFDSILSGEWEVRG